MRGSVLGVGTDIAGSIRIPAICNGIYSLKPSADRIPYGGQTSSARGGLAGIKACAGPLATSVRDLELFMRLVTNADPWQLDSSALFSPWRIVSSKSALRLGFIEEDPHFPLHPPVLRTLAKVTEKLQEAGNKIIPLKTLLIMPGYQGTAQPHDLFGFVPYTVLWNVMDVSSRSLVLRG